MLEKFASRTEYLDFVESQWAKCFSDKGYIQEPSAKITSKVDDSVVFVGSGISTLKKYVAEDTIGKKGRFIIQPSLRTQVLKNLKNSDPVMFGSYFKNMSVLTEPNLEKVVFDTFDYLTNYLSIPLDDIRIRISAEDEDLMKAIGNVDKGIIREVDTFGENYYNHRYGMEKQGIVGRNFNVGIRKKDTDSFLDIGNVLVMESDKKIHATEMGFGNCTLSMSHFGDDSTVASSRMADVMKIDSAEKMKFADAVGAVAVLQSEDIRNSEHWKKFKYLLNRYCDVICHWRDKLQVSDEQILADMRKFIALEYKKDFKGEDIWTKNK